MAALAYDEAASERLEAVYLGRDVVAQRADTLTRLDIRPGETVLDIGSGPGFLAEDMAVRAGASGQVTGIDLSPQMVARAQARSRGVRYFEADATDLPFDDGSFDVVVSTQTAEYVPDIAAFCTEFARVMSPGGRGLVMASDWRTLAWHAGDAARMTRVLRAFEPHCAHISLPRHLAPQLRAAGLEVTGISAFPILHLTRHDGSYSGMAMGLVDAYVRGAGTISDDELDDWAEDLAAEDAAGRYYFATSRISFHVTRAA